MPFTRSELEILSIPQLSILCRRYGIRPLGKGGKKQSYIAALLSFPDLALKQMQTGKGLSMPTLSQVQELTEILDKMGELTPEQSALLRLTLEGHRLGYPARHEQERLLLTYKIKNLLMDLAQMLML